MDCRVWLNYLAASGSCEHHSVFAAGKGISGEQEISQEEQMQPHTGPLQSILQLGSFYLAPIVLAISNRVNGVTGSRIWDLVENVFDSVPQSSLASH